MKAINVKEALVSAREKCLGMTEDIYQFADFLASRLNDTVTPEGLVTAIALAISDITTDQYDSEYIKQNKRDVLTNAKFVLQIVDVMTDKEYSMAVRTACEQVFPDWSPMVRLVPDPSYRTAPIFLGEDLPWAWYAAEWWIGAMQLHSTTITLPNGKKMPTLRNKNLTQEQIDLMIGIIALVIDNDIFHYKSAEIRVDYELYGLLDEVCEEMEIDPVGLFPCKTTMYITKEKIELSQDGAYKTLWKAE